MIKQNNGALLRCQEVQASPSIYTPSTALRVSKKNANKPMISVIFLQLWWLVGLPWPEAPTNRACMFRGTP